MKKLLYTIAFSFVINLAFAQQEASFRIEVSSDSVLLGNYFEVKFILESASGNQFEPPAFDGFSLVGGPNQSSNFSMVNGKISQSMAYSYYLEPQDIGNYYIEAAYVKVGEETLETTPKMILVVANPDEVYQSPQSKYKDEPNPLYEITPTPKKPKKKRKVYKL